MGFIARSLNAIGIRSLLQSLTGVNRLDASAIKNLPVGGGGGDMLKATYDTNDNGIVDNTAALNGQAASYYLDRVNHSGSQLSASISDFAESVDDRVNTLIVAGAGITKVYDDPSNTLTLSSTSIGGGLTAWSLKTANYTAIAGDRLRVDATAGDVVISLPAAPSASDADIWIQRLDLTANKVLLRTGSNKINSQTGQDGVFTPLVVQLIERISYVNTTIGWLGQHDRLTYQAAPPPVGVGSGILNLPFDTDLLDISAITKSVTNSGVVISSAQSVFGGSSAYFNGTNASLAIPRDGSTGIDLRPAAINAYTIEMWLYPELVGARNVITNYNLAGGAQPNTLIFRTGSISNGITNYINATGVVINQWQHVAIVVNNATPNLRFYRQGNLVGTVANNFSQSASTLYIGGSPGDNNIGNDWYQGWIDNLIITPSEKYTANFTPPTTP